MQSGGIQPTTERKAGNAASWIWLTCCCALAVGCGSDVVVGPCDLTACDDGLPCTTDGCAKDGTCTHTARTGGCDDGNACTDGDTCTAGVCAGNAADCDDSIACTHDSCDKTVGCVHIASESTACTDGNACTDDGCDLAKGCTHTDNAAPCDDGNLCTENDACGGGACLPGSTTIACDDKNPCTDDACDKATGTCSHSPNAAPCEDDGNTCTNDVCDKASGSCSHIANTAPCDDKNACTSGDTCVALACAGTLDCACAIAAGQKLPAENCDTPVDDNCNGFINETSVCGATVYKYSVAPECGAACYYDEAHNVALNGPSGASNNAGFDQFATGQLLDGLRGVDDWSANLGGGSAFEWVAWTAQLQVITVEFAKPRNLTFVRLGLNNKMDGAVSQPPQVEVRVSLDAVKWSPLQTFKLADGTEPAIPAGKRGDIVLPFALEAARYIEIRFLTPGSWTFVDEMEFD